MYSRDYLFHLIDYAAQCVPSYDFDLLFKGHSESVTRFANSEIHQNVHDQDTKLTLTLYGHGRKVRVTTNQCCERGIDNAVARAVRHLPFGPEGCFLGSLQNGSQIVADYYSSALASDYTDKKRAEVVREALSLIDDDRLSGYGALTYNEHLFTYGSSRGDKKYVKGNSATFSSVVSLHEGGSGSSKITSTRTEDFSPIEAMRRAYEKAKRNQNPATVEPGEYTVILEPQAVGDILALTASMAFTGQSIEDSSSFLKDRIGDKVFDDQITIVDDWTNENTLPLPFDYEGIPRTVVSIIENGVARGVVHDLSTARRAGVEPTGHSYDGGFYGMVPLNLVMANGDKSIEQMIMETSKGLLISRLHYINPVNRRDGVITALTKDGLFRIEDGRVVEAVKNMRLTDSVLRILSNVEGVSRERMRTNWFFFGNYYVPALKIKGLHLVSRAES